MHCPAAAAAANTGHLLLRPTPGALSFVAAWNASAAAMLAAGTSEQESLPALEGMTFLPCTTLCQCHRAQHNVRCRRGRAAGSRGEGRVEGGICLPPSMTQGSSAADGLLAPCS